MSKTTIKIEGMMCESCVKTVTESISKVKGVKNVEVDLKKGTATIENDGASEEDMVMAVLDVGFKAKVKHGLFK